MRTVRVKSPRGVDFMAEHILDDDHVPAETIVEQVKERLEALPEYTFVVQVWDDTTDEGELVAFVIAANDPRLDHTYIYQFWRSKELTTPAVLDSLFERVSFWTENFGKTKIRMQDWRDTENLRETFGFKPKIAAYEVDLLEKENNNGIRIINRRDSGVSVRGSSGGSDREQLGGTVRRERGNVEPDVRLGERSTNSVEKRVEPVLPRTNRPTLKPSKKGDKQPKPGEPSS